MTTPYQYTLSSHFPGGVNLSNLIAEISADSVITTALYNDMIEADYALDLITLTFKAQLDYWEENQLINVVFPNHDTTEVTPVEEVTLAESHTDGSGFLYARPKASGLGYVLNDRDILVRTATMGPDPSGGGHAAYEDLLVNNPYPPDQTWGTRTDWGEVSLVGVFKSASPLDPYAILSPLFPCANQADATDNAVCSIFEYQAKSQGTPIAYEIQGGGLYVDAEEVGLGNTMDQLKQHQIYAIAAPNLPVRSRFFDGYLMAFQQEWMLAMSSDAMRLDPNAGVDQGAPFGEASKLWVYIFYPPGLPPVHHILRLKTFRFVGT